MDCVTMSEALDIVDEMVAGRMDPGPVAAVNSEKVIKVLDESPELLEQLYAAPLLIPDGIGLIWAAHFLNLGKMQRVAGADLMPAICERAAEKGYSVFLYGARPHVNEKACEELLRRYPGLKIAGRRDGYVPEDQTPGPVEQINASGADILFLALGSPRQENWISAYFPDLNVKVCQGVGGTFDVLAGELRRAPAFWRAVHLEWAYRSLTQPSRLAGQKRLVQFVWRVIKDKFRGR